MEAPLTQKWIVDHAQDPGRCLSWLEPHPALLPRSLDSTNKCYVYLGPVTPLQGIHWRPSHSVNFLKGGVGTSWGGLLTPGSPCLRK